MRVEAQEERNILAPGTFRSYASDTILLPQL